MIGRLTIVGVGLLGGSAAKAARAKGLATEIVGVGRDVRRLEPAVRDGTLDRATTVLEVGLREADFVLLAVPVVAIEELLTRVWALAPRTAVVTDVGSTKRRIVGVAEGLGAGGGPAFVGSHPMAGSEQSGYDVAREDLFGDATVILTPTERTAPRALEVVGEFWKRLGARVRSLDPEQHDRIVAAISHAPHAVAFALMDAVARFTPEALEFAARGFRDTTRIAASDPDVWAEIFTSNPEAVLQCLQRFRSTLGDVEREIANGSATNLRTMIARVRAAREALR